MAEVLRPATESGRGRGPVSEFVQLAQPRWRNASRLVRTVLWVRAVTAVGCKKGRQGSSTGTGGPFFGCCLPLNLHIELTCVGVSSACEVH